jgi:hypothetical protein
MLNIWRNLSFGFTVTAFELTEAVADITIVCATNMYKIMLAKSIIF